MIITKNVCKKYGAFQALDNVSFEIKRGEIVGFLGKNGAGKTSLMRILTSYLQATSGEVFIDGIDVAKNSLQIRQKIGYLPETPPLYDNMSVKDYLRFAAEIKDVPAKRRRRQIDKVLEQCQLEGVSHKTISTLSKGYKQRVGIAQAIIHEPALLILDEPTSGLDPIQNRQVRQLIQDLNTERTVILSSHTLAEIEQVAQRVLMIKAGKLIVDEDLPTLIKQNQLEHQPALNLEDIFIKYHQEECVV
ncbi:MAG: ABC transporter ATP-binding protein [Pseudomonadales bacterium]|nr:ABC transporter ATP-binding protein [Pseudomonadales bacterium]